MPGLWERSGAFLALAGSRARVGYLSVLQRQAHGAIDHQRHGEDKSEELNGRRLALNSPLPTGHTRERTAVPKDDNEGHSGFPKALCYVTPSGEPECLVIPLAASTVFE